MKIRRRRSFGLSLALLPTAAQAEVPCPMSFQPQVSEPGFKQRPTGTTPQAKRQEGLKQIGNEIFSIQLPQGFTWNETLGARQQGSRLQTQHSMVSHEENPISLLTLTASQSLCQPVASAAVKPPSRPGTCSGLVKTWISPSIAGICRPSSICLG